MEKFIFKGDWETSIRLELFSQYYAKKYTSEGIELIKKTKNEISLNIADEYGDVNPDPKPEQINTINFLLVKDNQLQIIKAIVKFLNDVIYPYYKSDIFSEEEYPESYPEVQTLDDFQRYFRLDSVSIYALSKGSQTYFCLYFSVDLLDDEHGLSIELIGDRCIDHGTYEGPEGYELAKDADLPPPHEVQNAIHATIDNEPAILHKTHPKYGKLKPWQVDANRRFPLNAYRSGKDLELIDYIKNNDQPIKQFTYLYNYAVNDKRLVLIDFFSSFEEFK